MKFLEYTGSGVDDLPSFGPVVRATLLHVAVAHSAIKCTKFLVHLGTPLEGGLIELYTLFD